MDRVLLKGYLDDGLSLVEIGALQNRDPSTVGYWVQKHGLEANGRAKYTPKGGLSREVVEPLVKAGLTLTEIAVALDRSTSTVRYWMKRHGLELELARRNREEFREAEANGETRTVGTCRRHGLVVFARRPDSGWRCLRCRSEHVSNWRRRTKRRLVEAAGGACSRCGYDEYQGALQFHHLDPDTKQFVISQRGRTRAFADIREEAGKCVLLCANCHAEVEAGLSAI